MNLQKLNSMHCHVIQQSTALRGDYNPLLYFKVLLRIFWGSEFEERTTTLDTLIDVLHPIRTLPTDTRDIEVWK